MENGRGKWREDSFKVDFLGLRRVGKGLERIGKDLLGIGFGFGFRWKGLRRGNRWGGSSLKMFF